jgi:hypothetical protein
MIDESLELANVLKVNDTKLPVLASLVGLSRAARQQIAAMSSQESFESQLRTVMPGFR